MKTQASYLNVLEKFQLNSLKAKSIESKGWCLHFPEIATKVKKNWTKYLNEPLSTKG